MQPRNREAGLRLERARLSKFGYSLISSRSWTAGSERRLATKASQSQTAVLMRYAKFFASDLMTEIPNQVSSERFRELKAMLGGKQEPADAKAVLRKLANDPATPPILRINIASAMLDLSTGRSVQSTMARLRRAAGLDPKK